MISIAEANHLVEDYLQAADLPCKICNVQIINFGWYFSYDSAAFLEGGDPSQALLGNTPVVVDHNGKLFVTSFGESIAELEHAYANGIRNQISTLVISRITNLNLTLDLLTHANFQTAIPETDAHGNTWRIPRPFTKAELEEKLTHVPATFPRAISFSAQSGNFLGQLRSASCCDFHLE